MLPFSMKPQNKIDIINLAQLFKNHTIDIFIVKEVFRFVLISSPSIIRRAVFYKLSYRCSEITKIAMN
jgi:hypothetical protein